MDQNEHPQKPQRPEIVPPGIPVVPQRVKPEIFPNPAPEFQPDQHPSEFDEPSEIPTHPDRRNPEISPDHIR